MDFALELIETSGRERRDEVELPCAPVKRSKEPDEGLEARPGTEDDERPQSPAPRRAAHLAWSGHNRQP
jgi:hypothetical protein